MLLLKIFFTTYQPSPDKGGLTCYELISYHFVIIIGLQKYGFSLNWQTISSFFLDLSGCMTRGTYYIYK